MKMMKLLKKTLSACLCIALTVVCLLAFAMDAQAATAPTSGSCGENVTWKLSSGTLTISGTGAMEEYTVSSQIPWTDSRESIKKIVIKSGVTTVANFTGYYCENLTSVSIANTVTTIGQYAFSQCDKLTSIKIPGSVTVIDSDAFYACDTLSSVTLNTGLETIESFAFSNCDSLATISIPASVTKIGSYAFSNCDVLKSMSISQYVTTIGNLICDNCPKLTKITVNSNNPNYCSDSTGVLFDKNKTELLQAPGAISGAYTIPDTVTEIHSEAFDNCDKLTGITIPDSVYTINHSVFYDCDALTAVVIPASVNYIGGDAFSCCDKLKKITVKADNSVYSSDSTGVLFDKEKKLLIQAPGAISGKYTIPSTVEEIGSYAFNDCDSLTAVSMPSGIKYVDTSAFSSCDNLSYKTYSNAKYLGNSSNAYQVLMSATSYKSTYCNIHSKTKVIAGSAFSGCSKIEQIVIPDSVTHINKYAFFGCSEMTKVVIGKNVQDIGASSFSYCERLATIVFTGNPPVMDDWNFSLVDANAYYPENNTSWVKDELNDFSGKLTWATYKPQTLKITTQPKSKTVKAGATAKFTVKASGAALSYQWQYRTSSSGSWKNTSATGNQKATLSIAAKTARHGYQYRCVITDFEGKKITTNAVTLNVLGVKTQPKSKTVVAGKTAKFTVSATGKGLTYQWQYRTSSSGSWKNTKATGYSTKTLSVSATTAKHGYQYRCRIKDSADNTVYTKTVSLYVLGIKTQPTSKSVKVGATAKFTVSAVGKGLTYQWQYRTSSSGSWKNVSSAAGKKATYSFTTASRHNGYQYRCRIKDSAGNVIYSNIVKLTVKK